MIQSVIQQPQPSVIQSPLQTVQISKGNVILLKQPANSVIHSTGGGTLQTVQVIDSDETDGDGSRKRHILARRPSYRKILNELGGGEISVIPAGSLQLSQGGEGLQTIAMTNTASAGGAIVHYAQGTDGQFIVPASAGGAIVHYAQGSDGQFIVPVSASELGGIKLSGAGGITQGMILQAAAQGNATTTIHNSADQMAEEATRKREIRLMKNKEAAKECRNKKKEYIKCLENRVAVLENQNKALIEELKTLKSLYCQNN